MEELIDLQKLANKLAEEYQNLYTGEEIELPNEFKNKVNQIDNNSITYQQYSAVVSTKGVQKGVLNIYLPNQWFYIASFFTSYYNELQKYKTISSEFFSTDRLKQLKGKSLTTVEENKLSKKYGDKTKEYIKEFVTNYDWWGGGKTIDRTDFFVSPILNYARLVNASQSYVADLCAFLAKNEELVGLLYNAINHHKNHFVLTAKTVDPLNCPLQKIYYGTPGSGKSHKVKEIVEGLYPEELERDKYVFRTTFHPDSDYASFVGCYKPQMDGTGDIKYEFTPQAFTNAYARAWKESEKQVYLVIEEINRGNCAQIFGDLFQLLDRKGGVSEYPINADTDLRQYLEKDDILGKGHEGIANGKLKLPANLNIVATMNTSDQSLFPMDSAFKRRWSWECVPINYDDDKSGAFAITIGNSRYRWLEFLKAVNNKIFKATDSEDKQMGNFFINGDVDKRQFIDKVMFYLWNDICKEEYRTTNNFFRNYIDDKKIETTEFSFNELFGTNAETLLKGFMVFLGVEPIQSEGDASVTETKTD